MNVLELFAGLGNFSLGLERTQAFKTVAFCEIDPYCQKLLNKHWPDVPVFGDVRNVNSDALRSAGINTIDVITAGFPCQPFSQAGKQLGTDDERYLWDEIARLISDFRPRIVILENVPNLLRIERGRVFGGILRDLAQRGYDAEWEVLSAAAFGAPHLRERVWIVAYPERELLEGRAVFGDSTESRAQLQKQLSRLVQPRNGLAISEREFYREDHGVAHRMDRLRALGNAIYPDVAEWIGRCVIQAAGI